MSVISINLASPSRAIYKIYNIAQKYRLIITLEDNEPNELRMGNWSDKMAT